MPLRNTLSFTRAGRSFGSTTSSARGVRRNASFKWRKSEKRAEKPPTVIDVVDEDKVEERNDVAGQLREAGTLPTDTQITSGENELNIDEVAPIPVTRRRSKARIMTSKKDGSLDAVELTDVMGKTSSSNKSVPRVPHIHSASRSVKLRSGVGFESEEPRDEAEKTPPLPPKNVARDSQEIETIILMTKKGRRATAILTKTNHQT